MPKSAITEGIRIDVQPEYVPQRSNPGDSVFVFAYHITITNQRKEPVQLLRRHWEITDATGREEEVDGAGVVGEQPVIGPGKSHRYSSGATLQTPVGAMRGYYTFVDVGGRNLRAAIPEFLLNAGQTIH